MPNLARHRRTTEHRYWSVILGCPAVRLSMYDDHGREFWMELPDSNWRDARRKALMHMQEAIDLGLQPGRVVVR